MPKKKQTTDELTLNGSELSSDEKLQDLVNEFKSELLAHPDVPVHLDLKDLSVIYSKGISIILGLFKSCKAAEREFRVTLGSDDIMSLFKMLKLDKVITVQKVDA